MVNLFLMASHGYPPGIVFHQEQGSRVVKECTPYFPNQGVRQSTNLRRNLCDRSWKPVTGYCEPDQLPKLNQALGSPVVVNAPDACADLVLLGFGIADKCIRHEKTLQFLISKSDEVEKHGIDLSLVSNLVGLQPLVFDYQLPSAMPLLYPSCEIDSQKPLLDFIGDMVRNTEITVKPDGRVIVTGSETEMRDVLSLVAEIYLSKKSSNRKRQSVLVPHYNWSQTNEVAGAVILSPPQIDIATVAPQKGYLAYDSLFDRFLNAGQSKLKVAQKKRNSKKFAKERDLYRRNHFHACESLLSLMIDKKHHGRMAIHSLKKSGPELPQLLMQFSAGIAGTGIAVLFSIVCKIACGRVSFCTSKLLSTGFGFGLVWLSWAVNRLRDTVVYISKNANKLDSKEEEMIQRIDKSINEIYFRVATLLAVAVLKFA